VNHIHNNDGRAASCTRLTNGLVNKEGKWLLPSGCGVQRKISRGVKPLAIWVATCAWLFSPCVPVHGGLLKADVDFSNYDVPLFDQIVNRIKAKISARLGEGENKQDRYFIVPFAYQDKRLSPKISHSFISVIRVLADGKQPSLTPGFRHGRYKNRNFEAFTISWMPHDFDTNPDLKLAVKFKNAVGIWGPYEIQKAAFDLGVRRKKLLDGGTIRYRADDRLYRKDRVAINCFHAMAGLEELYPNGGFLGTGFRMWGINGTARVLIEYTKAVRDKGLILEPVDIKKDLYGFVYAPERNSHGLYNPFPNASAYRQ
jgi:hypothetical protein